MINKKVYISIIILLIFSLGSCNSNNEDSNNIKILSGNKNGHYYSFISNILNNSDDKSNSKENVSFEVLSTPGSINNAELLLKNAADFAIVQGDIVSQLPDNNKTNILAVSPLFFESIVIFRVLPKNNVPKKSFLSNNNLNSIFVGNVGSGTYLTLKRILELSDIENNKYIHHNAVDGIISMLGMINKFDPISQIPFSGMTLSEDHPLIVDISDGYLDGWCKQNSDSLYSVWDSNDNIEIFYKSFFSHEFLSDNKNEGYPIEYLELDKDVKRTFLSVYKDYCIDTFKVNYFDKEVLNYSSVKMQSYLITNSKIKKGIVSILLKKLYEDNTYKSIFNSFNGVWAMPVNHEAYVFFKNKNKIKSNFSTKVMQIAYTIFLLLSIILVLLLGIPEIVIGFFQITKLQKLNKIWTKLVLKKEIIGIFLLIIIFTLGIIFILRIENITADSYGYPSSFEDISFSKMLLWILILIVSGNDQGMFPVDPSGQIILLLVNITLSYIVPILIAVYVAQWVKDYLNKNKGLNKKYFYDHLILLGWNIEYISLIEQLIKKQSDIKIVIISETSENPIITYNLSSENIGYIKGSPLNEKVLVSANYGKAKFVLHAIYLNEKETLNYGFPISYNNFIKKLKKRKTFDTFPDLIFINPYGEYSQLYRKLNIPVMDFSDLYSEVIPSLFTSGGVYSLIDRWFESQQVDNKYDNQRILGFSEININNENINEKCKQLGILTNSVCPFKKILDSVNRTQFSFSYLSLNKLFVSKGYILLGIEISYTNSNKTDLLCTLVSPELDMKINDIYDENNAIRINNFTIFLMRNQ